MSGSKRRKVAVEVGESESILDKLDMDVSTKVAAAIASPSVVSLVSRGVPADMTEDNCFQTGWRYSKKAGEDIVFFGCGTIIECEKDGGSCKYLSTIICPATLFIRTNGVQPHLIKVDVYLFDGKLCKGQVLACDFHYNLAVVRISTKSPLQTATLRCLDDVLSIHPSQPQRQFQLLPHSDLFKIVPGTKIFTLSRSYKPPYHDVVSSGVFSSTSLDAQLDCDELHWVKSSTKPEERISGPVINCSGEVIGIGFSNTTFLPVNTVTRWWNHFKSCGKYCRPWLGMEVANLHSCHLQFLEEFITKFPNISTAVVVTKVAVDSPAYRSGILPEDVIIESGGKLIHSKLEFFDTIWDMIGESIDVTVLRLSDGEKVKLSLTVGETTPDNFFMWPETQMQWLILDIGNGELRP